MRVKKLTGKVDNEKLKRNQNYNEEKICAFST